MTEKNSDEEVRQKTGSTYGMSDLQEVDTDPESGDRYYHWNDGESYPSVTTILDAYPPKKQAIKQFMQKPGAAAYRDRQGLLGSLMHHRILNEMTIGRIDPPGVDMSVIENYDGNLEADIQTCEALWEDACAEYNITPGSTPHIEEPVRHREHEYAGRFDLLTSDGETIVDLKVSDSIHDSYKMQVAAYVAACREMPGLPDPTRAKVVALHPHLDNNPKLKPQVATLDPGGVTWEHWFGKFLEVRQRFSNTDKGTTRE